MQDNIHFLPFRFDVNPALCELALHANAWNQIDSRTAGVHSPHREVSDIWVRYSSIDEPLHDGPHVSTWYPIADQLIAIRSMCVILSMLLGGDLGGVLITKVPAGKQVYPHTDLGWHARVHEKFVIQLAGNLNQRFCFENEFLSAMPGECYWFRNDVPHWVTNDSVEDRISLIVCLRRTECPSGLQ